MTNKALLVPFCEPTDVVKSYPIDSIIFFNSRVELVESYSPNDLDNPLCWLDILLDFREGLCGDFRKQKVKVLLDSLENIDNLKFLILDYFYLSFSFSLFLTRWVLCLSFFQGLPHFPLVWNIHCLNMRRQLSWASSPLHIWHHLHNRPHLLGMAFCLRIGSEFVR